MEAWFLTVTKGNYKYGKKEELNEPCDTELNQRYQYELIIINIYTNRIRIDVCMCKVDPWTIQG